MLPISSHDLLLTMSIALFVLGMIAMFIGILILATRATSRDMRTLATQTTNLVQKGLAEEVSGLVGNASALLDTVNQLTRTAAGVGVFLTLLGVFVMGAACWLAFQVI